MRIDSVTIADILDKTTDEALEIMFRHCKETEVCMRQLKKQVEALERKVIELERLSSPVGNRSAN